MKKTMIDFQEVPCDFLNSLPTGIIVLQRDLTVVCWNKCIADWTNIERDQIIGKHFTFFFPEFNKRRYLQRIAFTIKNGLPVIFSPQLHGHFFLSKLPNGNLRNLKVVVTPLIRDKGSETHVMFTVSDMTEQMLGYQVFEAAQRKIKTETEQRITAEQNLQRALTSLEKEIQRRTLQLEEANNQLKAEIQRHKKTEQALRESQEQIRLLLDSTDEAIYGLDNKGHCTFANKACLNMLGYDSEEQLLGKKMHNLIYHSDADGKVIPVEECKIYKSCKEGENVYAEDDVLWKSDNTNFPVEYRAHPIRKDGVILGFVVTFIDISERKQKEEEITKLSQAVEQSMSSIMITDINGNIQYANPKFL